MRPNKHNDFKGSLCLFKCYKICFTEYKVSLVTEIKASLDFDPFLLVHLFPQIHAFLYKNYRLISFTYSRQKGINQNKAWYCNAMRTFQEWMWHPQPLFHTAVYFIHGQDGWRECHWRQFSPFVREGEKRPFTSFSQGWFGKCFPISGKDLQSLTFKHWCSLLWRISHNWLIAIFLLGHFQMLDCGGSLRADVHLRLIYSFLLL